MVIVKNDFLEDTLNFQSKLVRQSADIDNKVDVVKKINLYNKFAPYHAIRSELGDSKCWKSYLSVPPNNYY